MNADPFENCPLRTFSCITTTNSPPYRIVDLEIEALDLFVSSEDSELDNHPEQHDNPEQQARSRERALRFLTGLNMTDVLLPDPHSCLNPTAAAAFAPSEDCNLQSFVISEDAMLPSTGHSSLKTSPKRVHACIHQSPARFYNDHSVDDGCHNAAGGYRFYLVKDVTEMHALALAAKNGIRASGRLSQRQQQLSTRRDRARKNRRSTVRHESEEKKVLSHKDSGISLDDLAWGSAPASLSSASVDHGLLILQVTKFGTIDHAFAIPQSDETSRSQHSNQTLFLAQDKAAIETMASNSLMAYVHPQDLPLLCKGLDDVCKGRYTIFRARWRIEGLQDYDDEDSDDDGIPGLHRRRRSVTDFAADFVPNTIKYEGELYEEWVDPSANESLAESAVGKAEDFAWTEVTGVLAQGYPVLVVRPMTMPEVEEMEASGATAAAKAHTDTSVAEKEEDDEGYLEMEHDCELDETSSDCDIESVDLKSHLSEALSQSLADLPSAPSPTLIVRRRTSQCQCQCQCKQHESINQSGLSLKAWPPLSAVALDAWNQWIDTLNLTKDQFATWREHLLDSFLNQTVSTVSKGMTILGCDGLEIAQPFPYYSPELMIEFKQQEQKKIQAFKEQQAKASAGKVTPRPNLSGLNRAGKVLEAQCPALDGVVRRVGTSWIGQRIFETGRLDKKLDMVAGHAMDLWESEDRVATLTNAVPMLNTAVPMLNTLSTYASYTPISFFASKIRK
ncbi:hypothetical protein BGX34_007658 [Mortierella sp. NVP85]|nr:hypothetical protein BGX34_007658 [Mortierella sp. NVP85]